MPESNLPPGVDDPGNIEEPIFECSECGNQLKPYLLVALRTGSCGCPIADCGGRVREIDYAAEFERSHEGELE